MDCPDHIFFTLIHSLLLHPIIYEMNFSAHFPIILVPLAPENPPCMQTGSLMQPVMIHCIFINY